MNYKKISVVTLFLITSLFVLQSHSDGRATRNRDNTGAPGGQTSGNGTPITCSNCHGGGDFDLGLNLELIDQEGNVVSEYSPNETYTARLFINTISGNDPNAYGFQMVSLLDSDNSDVNGWVEGTESNNAQLTFASSTGRVYAEHDGASLSNELVVEWTAPDNGSGDISFYAVGTGVNGDGDDNNDVPLTPIQITYPEKTTTSTISSQSIQLSVFPNPTSDFVRVKSNRKIEHIVVYDVLGRQHIQAFPQSNDYGLDLIGMNSGLYIISVQGFGSSKISTHIITKE